MASKKKFSFKKSSPLAFLVAFSLTIGLLVIIGFLVSQIFNPKKTGKMPKEEDSPPQQVKISNITGQGFTVSWISEKPSLGSVIFSASKNDFQIPNQNLSSALDQRGQFNLSKSHFVNLNNLEADKPYYFLIKSGATLFFKTLGGEWEEKGLPAEQKTSSKNSTTQDLVQGQVLMNNGQVVPEAFVFLEIPGKSSLLSALTNDNGEWQIDLANLKSKDSHQPLKYLPGKDLFRLTTEATSRETTSSYQLAPFPTISQVIINFNPD